MFLRKHPIILNAFASHEPQQELYFIVERNLLLLLSRGDQSINHGKVINLY